MADWPRDYHPIHDGQIDRTRTVQLYPHQPGGLDQLRDWCGGGDTAFVNGGPVLIVPGTGPCAQRLVGLGDVAVADGDHPLRAVPGGEISARYSPADLDEAPPVAG